MKLPRARRSRRATGRAGALDGNFTHSPVDTGGVTDGTTCRTCSIHRCALFRVTCQISSPMDCLRAVRAEKFAVLIRLQSAPLGFRMKSPCSFSVRTKPLPPSRCKFRWLPRKFRAHFHQPLKSLPSKAKASSCAGRTAAESESPMAKNATG